ncbi:MAG TPA: hypothetical protein VFV33_02370 [Gemmatimonadaceae bacterium]|nr:hypothetical protein [Gemmatimonadaceae bacterium]
MSRPLGAPDGSAQRGAWGPRAQEPVSRRALYAPKGATVGAVK